MPRQFDAGNTTDDDRMCLTGLRGILSVVLHLARLTGHPWAKSVSSFNGQKVGLSRIVAFRSAKERPFAERKATLRDPTRKL